MNAFVAADEDGLDKGAIVGVNDGDLQGINVGAVALADGELVGFLAGDKDGALVSDGDIGLKDGCAVVGALTGDLFNYHDCNYKQNFVVVNVRNIYIFRNGIHIVIHTRLDQ